MFLFALLQTIISHVGAFFRKNKSTAQDLTYLKKVHKNFAIQNMGAELEGSGIEYSSGSEPAKPNKGWLKDVIASEQDRKQQNVRSRTTSIRKKIRGRADGAKARWVGGR